MNLGRHDGDEMLYLKSHQHMYKDEGGFVMLVSYVNGRLYIELQRDLSSRNDYQYSLPLEFSILVFRNNKT